MTVSDLLVILTVGVASFRVQRVVTMDSITASLRAWLWRRAFVDDGYDSLNERQAIARRPGFAGWAWDKCFELASCPWCLGWWTTILLWAFWQWADWSRSWIMLAAAIGVQAFISSRRDA